MRQPSRDPYWSQWHEDAVRGLAVLTHEGEPNAGYFKKRKAPFSREFFPAAIWYAGETDPETGELTGDETLQCHIAGFTYDAHEVWLWLAKYPIERAEYDALMEAMKDDPGVCEGPGSVASLY